MSRFKASYVKDVIYFYADLGMSSVTTKPRSRIRLRITKVRLIAELIALSTIRCASGTRLAGMLIGALVCIFSA